MEILRKTITVLILLAVSTGLSFAATTGTHDVDIVLAPVAAIAVSGGNITLSMTPGAAGAAVTGDTDNTVTVQYTTVNAAVTRRITAEIDAIDLPMPVGTTLSVVATVPGGEGTAAASADLTAGGADDIITAIPSCATGTLGTDGATLTYTLGIVPATVVANSGKTVSITLTILDT
jgi:hypothetical protein